MNLAIFAALLGLIGSSEALIGFGAEMYNPICAFACRGSISSAPLSCSQMKHGSGGHHGSSSTSLQCYSQDTSFLTTLAYCISTHCEGVEPWRLEQYWAVRAAGTSYEHVDPKWTYQQALAQVEGTPSRVVNTSQMLDFTGIADEKRYERSRGGSSYFEWQESLHSRYGTVLLSVGAGLPVLLTLLTFLPGFSPLFSILKPYVVYPAIIRRYHVQPLPYLLGNAPTLGQSWYIIMFLLLNIFVTALDYKSFQPNAMFSSTKDEILIYVANRTGVLAFALAPLVLLFAGRNNVLLWLTNWSHSTYLLLHRWIARIFTLQVIIHSIAELEYYKSQGTYKEEEAQAYWIWGAVATVASCIMVVISVLWFRRAAYEIFLVLHVLLAAFVIIGCWYHVELLFSRRWGYEQWLYAACAVWFFDRVMRLVWIARNGRLRAELTEIDDHTVRIDVPGPKWGFTPGQHAYVYFPGAKRWTFWEAHPFSVIPLPASTEMVAPSIERTLQSSTTSQSSADCRSSDDEKNIGVATSTAVIQGPNHYTGVRFYLRKHSGITKALNAQKAASVLLEGPYYNHNPFFRPNVATCDRVILFAGGVGITGVLSFALAHPSVKLYWSAKHPSKALVDDVQNSRLLSHLGEGVVLNVGGPRFNFETLLREETSHELKRQKIGVVVCGPPSFCDDLRAAVVKVGKAEAKRVEFTLAEEAFSW